MASNTSEACPSSCDSAYKAAEMATSAAEMATAAAPAVPESGKVPPRDSGVPATSGGQLATMKLNDTKAGMEGLDTEKINQIIEEASRGSKFYNHKKQRQEKIDERIRRMLELKSSFTPEQIARAEAQMDELTAELERSRDLSRFVVHVDMDAFYAAVEMRDRPELRDVPMAVGSSSMLSTSNYLARRFGVRAAMPGFIGRKLCPHLVIVPCDFDKYRAASQLVQGVLARYDPHFSMASLDEAYLDITDCVHAELAAGSSEEASEEDGLDEDRLEDRLEDGLEREEDQCEEDRVAQRLVQQMRAEIHEATRLTASAGIAVNGMLAKICSDQNKPNGQYFLPRERGAVLEFLRDLPVRKVCGIGNVLSQQLAALGVTRCGELVERRGLLRLLFSETAQRSLLRAGLGADPPPSPGDEGEEDAHQKSVSTETTFAATADVGSLTELLGELCTQLSEDLRRKRLRGRTVTLKLKTSAFVVRSRACTLAEPTAAAETLLAATRPALLRELAAGEPLRLLGVRASALTAADTATSGRRQATLAEMAGRSATAGAAPGRQHECPVCGRPAGSLSELSAHVDRCLDAADGTDDGRERRVTVRDETGPGDALCGGGDTLICDGDASVPHDGGDDVINGDAKVTRDGEAKVTGGKANVTHDAGGAQEVHVLGQTSLPVSPADPAQPPNRADAIAGSGATSAQGDTTDQSEPRAAVTEQARGTGSAVAEEQTCSGPAAALCPVCSRPLPEELLHINRHLDECLNQQLLSRLTDDGSVAGQKRPAAPRPAQPPSKLRRIDAFFPVKR